MIDHQPGTGLPKGSIVLEGRNLTGYGGFLHVRAGDSILVSGPILVGGGMNNNGGEAGGGDVILIVGCGGITMEDTIDLKGGAGGGGALDADSSGPITLTGTIDARARRLGGHGGIVFFSSGGLVDLGVSASINVDGHNTAVQDEDGEGGLILAQACTLRVDDDAATGGRLSALGAVGGTVSLEASKIPLAVGEHALRVGNKALLNATGELTQGVVFLGVGEHRPGYCSNNVTVACTTSVECTFGCNSGVCTGANPETEAVFTQFVPTPVVEGSDKFDYCGLCD